MSQEPDRAAVATGSFAAIKRSLDIYYRDTARTVRMDALNAKFVPDGGLAFDLGAHVGDRTGSFLRLGAKVVAVEPQPDVFRALLLIYGKCERAQLRCEAVGAKEGTLELYVNSENPTVTTGSKDLIIAAQTDQRWQGQVWNKRVCVPVNTLDRLIDQYGVPDFVKIDVEGYELDVLNGLTTVLPALSYEFTIIQRGIALACLDRLGSIGSYVFNYSLGEDHQLRHPSWIDAKTLQAELLSLPPSANSGDIFAKVS